MLTLITGGPGTGKTAWVVQELFKYQAQQPYRQIFIHGIQELKKLEHTTIYCRSPLCDLCQKDVIPASALFVEDWPKWFKSHHLIVIDEVQRVWPSVSGPKIDAISRLQTHRHYGLDFWLVSQSPKLLQVDVRAMITKHIHLVGAWSGRSSFEWPEVKENISSRSDAIKRPYKLPKSVFSLYKSAEIHTKQSKTKPFIVYGVFILVTTALLLSGYAYRRISVKLSPEKAVEQTLVSQDDQVLKLEQHNIETPEAIIRQLTPVIPYVPWTAPIYKELAKPVSFPQVSACIASTSGALRCQCYSQQATLIDMPQSLCLAYVAHKTFNHFKPDTRFTDTSSIIEQPITIKTEKKP